MRADELRIGNLLQGDPIQNVNQGLYSDGVNKITGFGIHQIEIGLLNLDPITLTEEWLIKFGFVISAERNGRTAYIKGFKLWRGDGWDNWNYSTVDDRGGNNEVDVDLPFVHQLQNIYFSLTGEELEITLSSSV